MKPKNEPVTIENGEAAPAANTSAAPDELAALTSQAEADHQTEPGAPGAPEPEPEVPTSAVLAMLYKPLAEIAAPNWKLDAKECEQLAEAHALVIDKYFPGGLGNMGPEISAVLVTVAILGVRFNKPLRAEPKKDAAAA